MTTELHALLRTHLDRSAFPGAVALLARGDQVEVVTAGVRDLDTGVPMTRDTIVRFASITKPLTAAVLMMLIEDGALALTDAVDRWLPELADRVVVRTPHSPVEDVVPARAPITVHDLLSGRSGYGFPSDFSLPQVQSLFTVQTDGRELQSRPAPDEWLRRLAEIPLLYQPGEAWLYDTSSDLQGILIERVTGQLLPEVFATRLFQPLGMVDSGFVVPADRLDRFATYYQPVEGGGFVLADRPTGQWSHLPAFRAGSGGVVGTVDDWLRFGRVILGGGTADGQAVLSPEAVRVMTSNHLTPEQRAIGELFLEGEGWGYGGSVDIDDRQPWNVPGRYGWVGGTGTSAHVIPAHGTVALLLTQVGATSPVPEQLMRDFWTYAAQA